MKKPFLYLTFFLFCSGALWGQSLSFEEAVAKMRSGNQKLKGIEKQAQAATEGQKAYQGLYYPQLSLNASYAHLAEPLSLNFNDYKAPIQQRMRAMIGGLPPLGQGLFAPLLGRLQPYFSQDWRYEFQKQDIWRVSADARWVLYAGGKVRAANKVGALNSEMANIETKKTEYALISELAERYYQVQLAQKALEVRQQSLETAEHHYENAQKFEKNGMIASIEVMQAKKAVTDAKREVLAAEKDMQLARTALNGVMGSDESENLPLSSELFEVAPLQELTYYQQQAKENFPLIVQAKLKQQMAAENVKVQQSGYLPDVAAIGKKYLWSENLPLTEPDNWVVGVGLQWNLFNGLQDKHKIA